jgi:hypothetical protein
MMGVLLILHGLAHASAGMWATDIGGQKLVTILWEIATLGFMAAGAGLIGIDLFHRHWKTLTAIASVSSLALLLLYGHPLFVVGIAADFTVMGAALLLTRITSPLPPVPKRSLAVHVILMAIIAYVGTLIALRPWYSSWGTTRSERQMVMIGDPPLGESHFRIDHAVTINAPADSVWPWLAQIGQDRGGFYSYDWLERTFGARIHNANAVVPAWQTRNVGDKVRAVQPTFLGGIFGNDVGWKITQLEPGRAIVLENWGAFVVEPIDAKSSRLHIRTRGPGVPTVAGIALSPISLLTFEPAHFIMERGMLLGIKKRAESASIQ